MEERIEFQFLNDFLEQANRVKKMYSQDGYLFFDDYQGLKDYYGGGILLPEGILKEYSTYYVIKKEKV